MSAEFGSHRGLLSHPTGSASVVAVKSSEAKVEPKPCLAGPPILPRETLKLSPKPVPKQAIFDHRAVPFESAAGARLVGVEFH
jgi:hypothetical protein